MWRTCLYAEHMSKMVPIRDVPERLHRTLKSRAAQEGLSLSDFIRRELERSAERPTMREWLEHTKQAKPIPMKESAAQIVRKLRMNGDSAGCLGRCGAPHQRPIRDSLRQEMASDTSDVKMCKGHRARVVLFA